MHFCWAMTLSDVHFVLISIHPILSISSYARNQISTLPYEAVPREWVSQERAANRTTGSFNCSIKERVKNTIIIETEVPSMEADRDILITEEAANVTEDGPL